MAPRMTAGSRARIEVGSRAPKWASLGLAVALAAFACGEEEPHSTRNFADDEGAGGLGAGGGIGGAGGMVTATSTTATSATITTTVTSGGVGGSCDDNDEPNDSESAAGNLGDITDCDGTGKSISGTLDGPSDVDWFRYQASDNFGCVAEPSRALVADGSLRLCKFVECLSGSGSATCKDGASSATSPAGHPGCCHNQGFTVDIECPGSDDSTIIRLRLDDAGGGCTDYTLDFHF